MARRKVFSSPEQKERISVLASFLVDEQGLSQVWLATQLDASTSTIWRWKTGVTGIHLDQVKALAKLLAVELGILLAYLDGQTSLNAMMANTIYAPTSLSPTRLMDAAAGSSLSRNLDLVIALLGAIALQVRTQKAASIGERLESICALVQDIQDIQAATSTGGVQG